MELEEFRAKMDEDDFQRWRDDPATKMVMKFLNDFSIELVAQHGELFTGGTRAEAEDFYRDSERYITLQDIINTTYSEMELFYDQTSMGPVNGASNRRH